MNVYAARAGPGRAIRFQPPGRDSGGIAPHQDRTSQLAGNRATRVSEQWRPGWDHGQRPTNGDPDGLDDLTTAGGGSLRGPVTPPAREQVATFTAPRALSLDAIWHGRPPTRLTDATRGGSQGDPFGSYRPGRSIEHEPVDKVERDAQHTAQKAAHVVAGAQIRAALRGA